MSAKRPKRRSIEFFPSKAGSMPVTGDGWFLARDIPLGILPLGYFARESSFRIRLQPNDETYEAWLTNFLYVGQHRHHSLQEAVVDFISTTAHYFGYFGEVYFEILKDADGEPARLTTFATARVLRTPTSYLQLIPKLDREHYDGRRYAVVPRTDAWHLSLPADLGGPRAHRRLVRQLTSSSPLLASVSMLPTPGQKNRTGYDFAAHRDASARVQERAMRRWGSFTSRQSPVGPSTEYFYIARRLAFRAAQAQVREHLLDELNTLLMRIAPGYSVELSGVPTARDIEETIGLMHVGDLGFKEALERTDF